ncbi:FUSC family protein [Solirubrobacter soli]|uniref:FUSC family protein n=1 Tax=Solirubrobacter soli TaxID=363832 RepID=UPI0003F6351F|nr:FUSC family protein [Solirubrobacter soli]
MNRLRGSLWPILQTALAATAAWLAAVALLPDGRPSFASIAAVICLGASYGQRGSKALQLIAGVVLGITVASVLVALIGTGSLQIGLMVVLAMSAAVLLRGGELLVAESAVSAILLVSLDPNTSDVSFTLNRVLEGLIGGGVALVVTSLVFPPDPALHVGRAAQAVFSGLGAALERVQAALTEGDAGEAGEALAAARALDPLVDEFDEALRIGRETARISPRRRASLAELERYGASFAQVDFAVRDTRVLARHAVRLARSGDAIDPALPDAVHELGLAVWSLASAYDQPERADAVRGHALRAGALAGEAGGGEVAAQIRSTAVDLRRAADLLSSESLEAPTEELLAVVTV